ncbi:MAG: NUDIX hydrolase [Sulfuricella sp.]
MGSLVKMMADRLSNLLRELQAVTGNPTKGLPEELFLYASQITPLVNVDLLIKDEVNGVLLTWRDDGYYGVGWHVPGGIIGYKETFSDRIHTVARQELGARVVHDHDPIAINQVIHPTKTIRGHFISLLFACRLISPPAKTLAVLDQPQRGQFQWHKTCPDNLISVHNMYRPYLSFEAQS